jgi:hypothetical protein
MEVDRVERPGEKVEDPAAQKPGGEESPDREEGKEIPLVDPRGDCVEGKCRYGEGEEDRQASIAQEEAAGHEQTDEHQERASQLHRRHASYHRERVGRPGATTGARQ